jgi:hypothetical protein
VVPARRRLHGLPRLPRRGRRTGAALSFAYDPRSVSDELAQARAWWAEQIEAARRDVNAFCALAFRDDQTAGSPPFEQQWFHREWQRVWRERRFSVTLKATGFGGTDQMIGASLWELGHDPNVRVSIISKTITKAQDRLAKIKRNIERNPIVREVFPELLPGEKWNSEVLRVKGACLDTTTDSVSAFGVGADLLGTRIDLGFLDDVQDDESTRSADRRKGDLEWADKSIITRLTTRGRLHVIANAFHPEDIAHAWRQRPGFFSGEYPAERPDRPDRGLLWPSFRSAAWLDDIKGKMTPTAYAQMYLCQARHEETRIFQKWWFLRARKRGEGLPPVRSLPRYADETGVDGALAMLLPGRQMARAHALRVVTGWDLATGKKAERRKSDLTCVFDLGLHPNGDRQVLWIEAGRWPVAESLRRLREHEMRYAPERHEVEDNGAQTFVVQFAQWFRDCSPRVEGFTTNSAKWDEALGIEGIGVEMQAGRWIIPGPVQLEGDDEGTKLHNAALLESYLAGLGPDRHEGEDDSTFLARRAVANAEYREAYARIKAWEGKLLDFHRGVHTADEVMACYLAVTAANRLARGLFRPLQLYGDPAPDGPVADAMRAELAMGLGRNFGPAPEAPPDPWSFVPLPMPPGMAPAFAAISQAPAAPPPRPPAGPPAPFRVPR